MGRRKIEIQPITHERNRSVTFLKRKNGLFKKAYELGVLCSVDIAVIVFEERPGHHPKLYQYSSTDVQEIVQRHIRHQGEKDTKGPNDFTGSASSKFEADDDGDEDDQEDEEEYTPSANNRASKKRKTKKSRNVNASGGEDFDQHHPGAPMAIPHHPPMPPMHNTSSLPVSSDRHAFREAGDESTPVASYPGAPGLFRPTGYPSFFPHAAPPGFMPPPGAWGDGRPDYRQRPGTYDAGGGPPPGYPVLPPAAAAAAVAQAGGTAGGPGNLFAFLEEQQRRGIDWPDSAPPPGSTTQGAAGSTAPSGNTSSGPAQSGNNSSDWLDFLSPRNSSSAPGGSSTTERPKTSSATAESWERGSSGSTATAGSTLPPKLRGGGSSKDGESTSEKDKDEGPRKVNGKGVKKEG